MKKPSLALAALFVLAGMNAGSWVTLNDVDVSKDKLICCRIDKIA